MHLLEVLNPVGQQRGLLNSLTISAGPRRWTTGRSGCFGAARTADVALKRAGEMLQERFENVAVNFYTGGNYPAPPPIVQQAARECDVVIGATAD